MPFLGKFPTQIVDPEVDIDGGAIDGVTIGATTASAATVTTLTSGNITTTGYIAGPSTFTIDPAAVGDNTGTLVVAGNLQVDGTTTTINSTTMTVDDLNITLASGAANAAAADGAGITVDGASATLTYNGTNDDWNFNKTLNVTGNLTSTGIDDNASSTAITIDSSQRVGIGTDSPAETLHVENASNNAILLNAPANRYNAIGFQSAGTDKWWLGRADSDQIAGDAFFIGADAGNAIDPGGLSAKLVINSSGNVGIGDTTPENKLTVVDTDAGSGIAPVKARTTTVNGRASYQIGNDADNWFMGIDGGNSDAFFISDAVGSSDRLVITQGGNVGIGNSDPNLPLTVTSNSGANAIAIRARTNDDYSFIQFYNNAGTTLRGQIANHNGDLNFYTGSSGTIRAKIDSSGNLLVGGTGNTFSAKVAIAGGLTVGDGQSSTSIYFDD